MVCTWIGQQIKKIEEAIGKNINTLVFSKNMVVYVKRTLKLHNCIYSIAQYLARASEKSDAKIMTSNIGRARGLIR